MTVRGICRGLRSVTDSQKLPSQPQRFQKEPAVRSRRPRYPCVSAPSPAQVTNGSGIPAMPAWVGGAFTEHSRRSPPGPRLMPGSLTSFKSPELQAHRGVPTPPSPAAPALISCLPPLPSIIGQQHSAWWWPLPLSVPWGQQPAFLSGTLSHYLPPSWSQNTLPSKKNGSLLHPSPQLKLCPPNTPKLLWPRVSAAGPARHPPPGQRVQGPVQSCPPFHSQQGWPARAQSRCSGKLGQMANKRDRQWGDAWEPERTMHSRVCHLVPTSSGKEGCFVQKLSRVNT